MNKSMLRKIKRSSTFRLWNIFSKLRSCIFGKHAIAMLCDTEQGLFAVDPADLGVGKQLLSRGEYGLDELNRLNEITDKDSTVLIVGTHIGALLIPLAKRVKKICGIEANPDTFRLLSINVLINNLTNVELHQVAANHKKETLKFIKNTINSGGSKRMPKKRDPRYFYDNPTCIEVPAIPLDVLLESDFDHIVMDIEGSEVFALQGMHRLLKSAKTLQIEFLPHHLRNVANSTVEDFVSLISPHFDELKIPTKNQTITSERFIEALQNIYDNDEEDQGLIFYKRKDGAFFR